MEQNNDIAYIADCCKRIEAQMRWGLASLWTNQDFEQLSGLIAERTNVTLSVTTLKRIWGKVKYDSAPATATLNTLAQFAGFESWRVFKQHVDTAPPPDPEQDNLVTYTSIPQVGSHSNYSKWLWIVGCLLVVTVVAGFYLMKKKAATAINAGQYEFSSRKVVTEGVPNSVVFEYNALPAPDDSVDIQQSWDARKRRRVSKFQHQHTSIYYYPGYFNAKLVVGDSVVKEHDLLIKTTGWLPLVEQEPVPVYFKESDALKGTELSLSIEQLLAKNIQLQPQAPWVRYSNVGNWGAIKTNAFHFEAEVKNDYHEGSAVCQYSEVRLLCKGGAVIIPLSAKGCVSDINLLYLDESYKGKENDLSRLGTDLTTWNKIAFEVKNKQARIYLNEKLVFAFPEAEKVLEIEGIDFRFQGLGSVRNVKLESL